ncbi:hypothetical protein BOTBODRAFT_38149 [Botryobasidium botryosum FD-172 SS1]|uniref:Uncharacterized protein n=1 Tax=Botryobasidium botryosum (strain FD-172 SS1) TaxID=930990 RepID=A0A067M8G0_BOTB1|nr:hypothetical protein BOTBODRAFT_38149 [Botryobasidium botryosum FD-172 SS1]
MPSALVARKANEYVELLQSIASLDYAPSALKQNEAHLKHIKEDLKQRQAELDKLKEKTKSEYADVASISRSATKRFFIRLSHGGKKQGLEQRIAKEQQEYLEAFQKEQDQLDMVRIMEAEKEEATFLNADLKDKVKTHNRLKNELESLYHTVFHGPTPEYPEEDEAEQAYLTAEADHASAMEKLNTESHTLSLLTKAERASAQCLKHMREAEHYSIRDMFGGGMFTDILERNALEKAHASANQVHAFMRQARQLSPQVQDIGHIQVPSGDYLTDIMFDSFYTDAMFHDKIQQSISALFRTTSRAQTEVNRSKDRLTGMQGYVYQSTTLMQVRRAELERIRRHIFLAAAGLEIPQAEETPRDELPAYKRRADPVDVDVDAILASTSRFNPTLDPPPAVDFTRSPTQSTSAMAEPVSEPTPATGTTPAPASVLVPEAASAPLSPPPPTIAEPQLESASANPRPPSISVPHSATTAGPFVSSPTRAPSFPFPTPHVHQPEPPRPLSPSRSNNPFFNGTFQSYIANQQAPDPTPSQSQSQPEIRPHLQTPSSSDRARRISWSPNPYAATIIRRAEEHGSPSHLDIHQCDENQSSQAGGNGQATLHFQPPPGPPPGHLQQSPLPTHGTLNQTGLRPGSPSSAMLSGQGRDGSRPTTPKIGQPAGTSASTGAAAGLGISDATRLAPAASSMTMTTTQTK